MCFVHRLPHRIRVSSTLPLHLFVTKCFLLRCIALPILPQIHKKRGAFGRNEKTRTYNSVDTICVFKCWLKCQLTSFEALLSLEKTIDDPTPSLSAVPVFRLVAENDVRQKSEVSSVLSYHIGGTCPVKEFSLSRNGAFWGTEKKRPTPIPSGALYSCAACVLVRVGALACVLQIHRAPVRLQRVGSPWSRERSHTVDSYVSALIGVEDMKTTIIIVRVPLPQTWCAAKTGPLRFGPSFVPVFQASKVSSSWEPFYAEGRPKSAIHIFNFTPFLMNNAPCYQNTFDKTSETLRYRKRGSQRHGPPRSLLTRIPRSALPCD